VTDNRPTRDDLAGRAYLELRRAARADGRLTDEYLRLYVLEGFLARLVVGQHSDALVIKGGVLLAAYDIRRPTADVDIAARDLPGQVDQIRDLVASIAAQPVDDGITFDTSTVHAEQIREEDAYSGVRVSLTARLATAVIRFHVDVNVGDPISPEPEYVQLPRLLGGEITLRGYPLPMVLAEKIVTAIERGTVNTRWRDLADIYLLTGIHAVSADVARHSIHTVAGHRNVTLRPLHVVQEGYADLGQAKWAAWRRKQKLDDVLPEQFRDVLAAVWAFADPLFEPDAANATWHRSARQWG
jgi:hypothetical protein